MSRHGDQRDFTGAQKAAVLMLAMGDEHCGRLLNMMHEEEINEISAAMAQLGSVRADVVEQLCQPLLRKPRQLRQLIGNYESTERCCRNPFLATASRRSWRRSAGRLGGRCGRSSET